MSGANVNYRIDPLRKDNYDTWQIQAQAILIKNGLWGYVNGSIPKPEKAEDLEKWSELDLHARSDLILIISPNELKQIKNCKSAKDVWDTLKGIHQSTGPARKATLLKTLILCKMKDGELVRDHLSKFMDTVDKLAEMNIDINNELLSIMMLYSLPQSYDNFRVAIESRDILPKPEEMKIKIIEESEARNKDKIHYSEDAYVSSNKNYNKKYYKRSNNYKVNKNFNNSYKPQSEKQKITCKSCGRFGHRTEDCWNKKSESTFKIEGECLTTNLNQMSENNNVWCLDSGCTSHMCSDKTKFRTLNKEECGALKLASKEHEANISGIGDVKIKLETNLINLPKTLYVPSLSTNLLSVSKITERGNNVTFTKNSAFVRNEEGKILLKAHKNNGLYYVTDNIFEKSYSSKWESNMMMWHRKLGHLNENDIKLISKMNLINGMKINLNDKLSDCNVCLKGKFTKLPFQKNKINKNLDKLEIVHSDLCGPMRVTSPGGAKYFVTFIDESSRYCQVKFLKQKNEVLQEFKIYKQQVENFTGKKIKFFQSDNGGELCSKEFNKFLEESGIQRRLSTPYTPQQNGLAERKNRTLLDMARCLLIDSGAPPMLWAEAINTANYLRNRCPSKSVDYVSPFQKWLGRTPSGKHLRIFGSKAFVMNNQPNKGKFDHRASEGVFVGYSEVSKAFRIWMPSERKIKISRDVKVIPSLYYIKNNINYNESILENELEEQNINEDEDELIVKVPIDNNHKINIKENNQKEEIIEQSEIEDENKNQEEERVIALDRLRREIRLPSRFEDYDLSYYTDEFNSPTIENNEEIWKEAVKEEFKAHIINGTWKIVNRPINKGTLGCRMVLKEKLKPDGTLERRKARLVARGFAQRYGQDFQETFAPVSKLSSIRLILGIAAEENLILSQLDVKTAFLNGDIDKEIYIEKPKNLEKYLQEILLEESQNENTELYMKTKEMLENLRGNSEKVCLLQKALYGLKQAGRRWFLKLHTKLKELGFKESTSDPCIYVPAKGGDRMIIAVYVDDLIIASQNEKITKRIKEDLMSSFEMRDLGNLNYCLGIEFAQNKNLITANQSKYIQESLKKFNMTDCKGVSTPLDPGIKLEPSKSKVNLPYQNLVGTLMYLAVATRPDLMYSVSYLSQFNSCFDESHWQAAKHVLRYLKSTQNLGLTYKKTGNKIIGFCDANWGSCSIDRRSYTGYCFSYAGGLISWEARKQRTVALSTAESEYMSLTEAAKEAVHLKRLANELGVPHDSIVLFNDNQAAQNLANNPIVTSKSKHIAIKQHYIRQVAQSGEIEIKYKKSEEMLADIFTKPLAGPRLADLRTQAGVKPNTS